jgi:class 3 adenylate cyclase
MAREQAVTAVPPPGDHAGRHGVSPVTALSARKREPDETDASPAGSAAMLRMKASVPSLAEDLASPAEPDPVKELYAAVGAYTGLGAASPVTAEIVGAAVAAATAALLIGWPRFGGAMPYPRDQVPRHDVSATSAAWPDLAGERRARLAGRNGRPDIARLSLASTSALPADGQMCAVFAVDIAGFTRQDRDDDIRLYLHEKLYEYLQMAFDSSGLPWRECLSEDRGDGVLIVVPPGISFKGLIHPLPERLRGLIRRHNHVSRESAGIQLRAAAHIGPVDHDGHGFVGTDVNFAFRMLEARPLKRMLAVSGAELCLAVSDYVYRSLVCRYPSLLHPDTFRTVRFQAKDTRARAWTYLPGASS